MSPDHVPQFIGTVLKNRYRVGEEIGRGGMASVCIADDLDVGRRVAVKFPRSDMFDGREARERFEHEIRKHTQLDHKSIVRILDVGKLGEQPYVVMQYLPGGTLADQLRNPERGRSPAEMLHWLTEIAAALDYVHQHGILHRDVKPSNVLFDSGRDAYLSDFGIAKAMGSNATRLTMSGQSPGTPLYMAPEISEDLPIGPTYDQYALGVMTYHALTGRFPHEGETPMAVMIKRSRDPPRPIGLLLPTLPGAVATAVMRAIDRVPQSRFPSCGAFARSFGSGWGLTSPVAPPEDLSATVDLRPGAPRPARRPEVATDPERRAAPATGTDPEPRKPLWRRVAAISVVAVTVTIAGVMLPGRCRSDADPDARTVRELLASRPVPPNAKTEELERDANRFAVAKEFCAAKANWSRSVASASPAVQERVLHDPGAAVFTAAAAPIEGLVAEVARLAIDVGKDAPIEAVDGHATLSVNVVDGSAAHLVVRPTPDTVRIARAATASAAKSVGFEIELPEACPSAQLAFERLGGGVLATRELRRIPGAKKRDPIAERVMALIAARPDASAQMPENSRSGFETAREFRSRKQQWEQQLAAEPTEVRVAVFAAIDSIRWSKAAELLERFVEGAEGLAIEMVDGTEPKVVHERSAKIGARLLRGDLASLVVRAAPANVSTSTRASAEAGGRFDVELALPAGVDEATLRFEKLDGSEIAKSSVRYEAPRKPDPPPDPVRARRAELGLSDVYEKRNDNSKGRPVWFNSRLGLEFVELELPMLAGGKTDGARGTASLLVCATECTNHAWYASAGTAAPEEEVGDLPVVKIRASEIVAFCDREGLDVPTYSEWNSFASDVDAGTRPKRPTEEEVASTSWYAENSGLRQRRGRHPVKRKEPNRFGLYDVRGNVWEMVVADPADGDVTRTRNELRALSPDASVERWYRGGFFDSDYRTLSELDNRAFPLLVHSMVDSLTSTEFFGFRPVFRPKPKVR